MIDFAPTRMSAKSVTQPRVLLVAPMPPPFGGMALQACLVERLLRQDGACVSVFAANFPFPKGLRFVQMIPGVRTLARALMIGPALLNAARQSDTVHIFAASWLYFFAVVYPAVAVGRILRRKVVLNYRGGEAKEFFRWWGWAAKPVFRWASTVTAPSQFLAEVIQDRFAVPVVIVPNVLELSRFRYRRRESLRPKMLVARNLEKLYDVASVIKAFQIIQHRYPEATLSVAGAGSQEKHLRNLVEELQLRHVDFLGQVAHQDLPAVYERADICLNASRADNFPGALVEASASGLVVVSTSVGGIPFLYENGKSALLVEPGDWEGLARAVLQLLESPSLATQLATEAVKAVQQCEWSKVREGLYAVYGFTPENEEVSECAAG